MLSCMVGCCREAVARSAAESPAAPSISSGHGTCLIHCPSVFSKHQPGMYWATGPRGSQRNTMACAGIPNLDAKDFPRSPNFEILFFLIKQTVFIK